MIYKTRLYKSNGSGWVHVETKKEKHEDSEKKEDSEKNEDDEKEDSEKSIIGSDVELIA